MRKGRWIVVLERPWLETQAVLERPWGNGREAWAVRGKGYWLSIEAIVSLALLGLLLSIPVPSKGLDLAELQLFKEENDLLLAFAKEFEGLDEVRAKALFEKAFPGKSGKIFLDGKRVLIGKGSGESVASIARFFGKNLELHELRVVVFK